MKRKNNPNLANLLQFMSDGKIHDGNALGEQLEMTRSAVWKMIQKLQQLGVKIISEKSKGYVLSEPLILLDQKKIQSTLSHKIKLAVFESLTSTNDYLMAEASHVLPSVCIAEMQTAGRGRLGRQWVSPFGRNIYLSLRTHFDKEISELSGLSLMVSLSLVQSLKKAGITAPLFVKWPNDVMTEQGKLSGILIELKAESNGGCEAIIGIGLNVNMDVAKTNEITQSWTSLRALTQCDYDRNTLAANLMNTLLTDLDLFQKQGFSAFHTEWLKHDYFSGKKITLQYGSTLVEGEAAGINEVGQIQIKTKQGRLETFASGDVKLLKN